MYYERTIAPIVKKISETFPALIVTGPRQVGKTTLLTSLAENNRKIVSLDNPTIRAFAKNDPELFLQRYAPPSSLTKRSTLRNSSITLKSMWIVKKNAATSG